MTWRNIARRKARSLLTVFGVAIGIAAIVLLMSVMGGLEAQLTSILERGEADLIVLQKDSTDLMLSRLRESEAQRLAQVPGVKQVSSVLFSLAKVEDYPFFVVNGLNVEEFTIDHFNVVEGRKLEKEDEQKTLLGKKIASHLGKELGERVTFLGDAYEIVGLYETGIRFEDYGGVVQLGEAQKAFDLDGFVSLIEVRVEDINRLSEVKLAISQRLPNVDVDAPSEVTSKQEDLQLLRSATSLVSLASVLFGTIIISNTMIMSVHERTREIGILRALGWRKRSVLIMLLKETVSLALLGGIIGIVVAVVGIQSLDKIALTPIPARVSAEHLIIGISVAVSLGVLGGTYPAVRAARMHPIEALGHEV